MQITQIVKLIHELLDITKTPPAQSPLQILKILSSNLPIKAASFYSYYEESQLLSLRAQIGLDYCVYKSFMLPIDSTAGDSLINKKVSLYTNLKTRSDYRDKYLLEKFNLHSMVAIPITSTACLTNGVTTLCQEHIGVICIYPSEESTADTVKSSADLLAPILSDVYSNSVNYEQLAIRSEILMKAIPSTDLSSFCHRLAKLVSTMLNFEGVSVYIQDERSKTLKLYGSTGIVEEPYKRNTFFKQNDKDITVTAFKSGKQTMAYTKNGKRPISKYNEVTENDIVCTIITPIYTPKLPNNELNPCVGIIKATNKIITHNNIKENAIFGWEDAYLLSFVASFIGVMTFLYSKVSRMTEDFERAIHGIQSNLLFVESSLNQLQERSKISDFINPVFSYNIPDSIDHIKVFRWQVERFTHREDPDIKNPQDVKLFGDILTKLPPIISTMVNSFSVELADKDFFDHNTARELPVIKSDANALLTVFRNLVENSVKYSSRNKKLEIRITWEIDENSIIFNFLDNGIGISKDDTPYIFAEGYKSEDAMRRCTVGAGLGLFQSKKIMSILGGDLILKNSKSPTIFSVTIPLR